MADDRGYVEPRCLPRAGPGGIPWRGSDSSSDAREPGYGKSQARSPHTYCQVPLGGTARKKDSATSPTVSPQGNTPWLPISRARTCHLRHLLPSLACSLLRHPSPPACTALQDSRGGAFHQLPTEQPLSLSRVASDCCSITTSPTRWLCPALMSKHHPTWQPVPCIQS